MDDGPVEALRIWRRYVPLRLREDYLERLLHQIRVGRGGESLGRGRRGRDGKRVGGRGEVEGCR